MIGNAFCGIAEVAQEESVGADDVADRPAKREREPDRPVTDTGDRKFVRIFAITVPAFFAREKPISRKAKPACMNMTSTPATITHIELIPTESGMPLLADSVDDVGQGQGHATSLVGQPPIVDFGPQIDIGQRSEMQAGDFAPRSKNRRVCRDSRCLAR
jgi:hypothetical protein